MPNSYHLQGRAIDIARRPGVSHAQIAAVLRAAGYNLIESLDEGDHSHFAFGSATNPRSLRDLKGATIVTNAGATAVPGAVAPLPPGKQLAADHHGTLLLDLPASAPDESSAAPTERMQARP
jgi:hypothetical protein